MSTFSKQQLRQLVIARRRPLTLPLGNLDKLLLQQLSDYYRNANTNTLQQAISQRQDRNIPIEQQKHLHQHYRQIQIYPTEVQENPNQTKLNHSLSIVDALSQALGPLNRVRISSLAAGANLPLHLDDPQQNRVFVLLEGVQSFLIEGKSNHLELHMKQGEIWFINTAWPHEVHNPGTTPRLALLIDLLKTPTNQQLKRSPCDANNQSIR